VRDNNPAPDDWFLTRSSCASTSTTNGRSARTRAEHRGLRQRDLSRLLALCHQQFRLRCSRRWVYTDTLNGNNRSFERFGIDSRLQFDHDSFGITNEAEIGLRYMVETMHDRTVNATRATPRTGAAQSRRDRLGRQLGAVCCRTASRSRSALAMTTGPARRTTSSAAH
jgi:Fe(3+) dicitrate transport protein